MNEERSPKPKNRRSPLVTVLLAVILVTGVGIMAYPTVSDWWNSMHQSRAIVSYARVVDDTSQEQRDFMLSQARDYNQRLLSVRFRFMPSEEDTAAYRQILDVSGTGIMGYIQIPSINVNLPVYHTTDESVLQVAAGHVEGSSLPVGGPDTHAAISGHRGLPRARLFSDLDKVVVGDEFTITILDQVLTYQVDQIRIVEPADVSELAIQPGEDLCTLITCTPYGINTHRLLVRGHRVETRPGAVSVTVTEEASRIPSYLVIPAVGVPLLLIFLVVMLIYYGRRGAELEEDELDSMALELHPARRKKRRSPGRSSGTKRKKRPPAGDRRGRG